MMMLVCNMFYANATHTYSHYYYTFYTAFRKRKTSELTMRIIVLHLESNARDSCTDKNAIMAERSSVLVIMFPCRQNINSNDYFAFNNIFGQQSVVKYN